MGHDGCHFGGCQKGRRSRGLRPSNSGVEGSRSAGESFDLSGNERKRSLEGARDTLEPLLEARRHRMTIRRRDFLKFAGAAALPIVLPRIARSAETASVYD